MSGTLPQCTRCGRFTTNPEVFIPHPVPGLDIEYRHCDRCAAEATDIARARAILTAVHEKATPGTWEPYYMLGDEHWAGIVSDGIGCVVNSRRDDDTMRAGDAEFITLMVDLYPVIDMLLAQSIPSNEPHAFTSPAEIVVSTPQQSARDVAAAILAWAERTGYEENE